MYSRLRGYRTDHVFQLDIQRALEQDASIYDYDGVYDEMKNEKNETEETKKAKDKKPKYMEALLKTAEKRQQLHERRTERKVQKEREAEGDEFADKGWTERILYF